LLTVLDHLSAFPVERALRFKDFADHLIQATGLKEKITEYGIRKLNTFRITKLGKGLQKAIAGGPL